jgi:hypothetical protein
VKRGDEDEGEDERDEEVLEKDNKEDRKGEDDSELTGAVARERPTSASR